MYNVSFLVLSVVVGHLLFSFFFFFFLVNSRKVVQARNNLIAILASDNSQFLNVCHALDKVFVDYFVIELSFFNLGFSFFFFFQTNNGSRCRVARHRSFCTCAFRIFSSLLRQDSNDRIPISRRTWISLANVKSRLSPLD